MSFDLHLTPTPPESQTWTWDHWASLSVPFFNVTTLDKPLFFTIHITYLLGVLKVRGRA